jgi:cell division protein FtsQ
MFKKLIWKRILIGSAWTICLGGLVALMSFIEFKKSGVFCKAVKIYIPGNQYFIDKEEVDNILKLHHHQLVGRNMESINLHDLENKLKANPFIESAKVYADMDGVIKVEISQRQPVMRVMNQAGQDFYIDQNGLKIPMSSNFTAKVLVANGYIDEVYVAQLYVNVNHEIELIPRVGANRILLGNADSLENKFRNLLVFYKQALPQVGWDRYKIINIKFANQVVGVKSDNFKKDSLKAVTAKADSVKMGKDTFTNN